MILTYVDSLERELSDLSSRLTDPHERECMLCYVYRMLEFPCRCDLSWAMRWRDLRAPRATALPRRLAAHGSHCDCELFLNGWRPSLPDDPSGLDDLGLPGPDYPDRMPPCPGVRPGSTRPCSLWIPKPRPRHP